MMRRLLSVVFAIAFTSTAAKAHLMVAQKGTLNVVDNKGYMVLSVPLDVFIFADQNKDGTLSMIEFNKSRAAIVGAIKEKVRLNKATEKLTLDNIRLVPSANHTNAMQLVIMGVLDLPESLEGWKITMGLFASDGHQDTFRLTIKDKVSDYEKEYIFTPEHIEQLI